MNQPHYNGSENQKKTSNTDEIFQKPNLLMGGTPSLGCPWPPALPGQDKDKDDKGRLEQDIFILGFFKKFEPVTG